MAATLPIDLNPNRPLRVWTPDCTDGDWLIDAPWSVIGGWITDGTIFVAISHITAVSQTGVR